MASGTLAELPPWATDHLMNARVGHLAYADEDGRPRVLPVTFALHEEVLWSAIDHKRKRPGEPARVRALRHRPEAALLVDLYDDDWSKLAWVQVLGNVAVLEASEAPAALEALTGKYPPYRERRPEGPLLRLAPDRALCWRFSE